MEKLALGTVQFGTPYGINNQKGIPDDKEIIKIFELAYQRGIRLLDTAQAYGIAEEKIAQLSKHNFKIVSKFPEVENKKELSEQISASLQKLNTNFIYGYLSHNADTLIKHPHLWETLVKRKCDGTIEKIGYSLYSPDQLEELLKLDLIPDLIQVPYSLLDRKFESYFPGLKKMGTEIHVRSVFLQGLYFMNPSDLIEKLYPLKRSLDQLHAECRKYNISIGALALNFVLENQYIAKAVIGVDTSLHLEQNISTVEAWKKNPEIIKRVNQITVTHKELLNPANW